MGMEKEARKPSGKDFKTLEFKRPVKLTKKQAFKLFIWNPETNAFCGRTAGSWGRIGLFYMIFYGVLAALVAICFCAFLQTIDVRRPRWQLEKSLIGTNPGLGFRPLPPAVNVESTLIWYKGTDKGNYQYWVSALEDFLRKYRRPGQNPGSGANIHTCDYNHPPGPGQVCSVDAREFAPCTFENHYGYHKSSPCIFLKLNKIFGWRPEYYNDSSALPEKMPNKLKTHIRRIEDPRMRNNIWVSCEGENPADQENIGPINLYPRMGFPGYYYPFENSEGYLSPLVAVHFERPATGVLINVECKAWAKNIIHNRNERQGSVHFELLID
ncbi:sodium/potassium-transporting ATPase subunit beta-2-like [Copidosoma floridanum]|uniref:sodium/potassium-transporting ATPase subunit beta-2-like n=1 Tax=Copidosoma floridanum TaxID=29053 RepID=UPI0006C9D536|nr:sodium/potassium-transporting ATPase subunit beta-2-like [Copidosoma floridanum]